MKSSKLIDIMKKRKDDYKYEYDGNLGAIQYQYDNELHEIFPMVDSYY